MDEERKKGKRKKNELKEERKKGEIKKNYIEV